MSLLKSKGGTSLPLYFFSSSVGLSQDVRDFAPVFLIIFSYFSMGKSSIMVSAVKTPQINIEYVGDSF